MEVQAQNEAKSRHKPAETVLYAQRLRESKHDSFRANLSQNLFSLCRRSTIIFRAITISNASVKHREHGSGSFRSCIAMEIPSLYKNRSRSFDSVSTPERLIDFFCLFFLSLSLFFLSSYMTFALGFYHVAKSTRPSERACTNRVR